MKVLFLDIDGVLCVRRPGICEPKLVELLRSIIDATGAKIVLSTDWRRAAPARAEVRRVLRTQGMDFIGWTTTATAYALNHRPVEILGWMRAHNKKVLDRAKAEGKDPEFEPDYVDRFVAIDDRPLLQERQGEGLTGHFVKTLTNRGLTRILADDAIKVLNEAASQPAGRRSQLDRMSIDTSSALLSASSQPGTFKILAVASPDKRPQRNPA